MNNNPSMFNAQPSQDMRGIIQPIQSMNAVKSRVGLATLGGFAPPSNVNTTNAWNLVRTGGKKDPNSFPPPINDISWQGFYTKEVNGYSRKLYWVCGYGILPAEYASGKPMMIMCQWWHTEQVNITDYRLISAEDWDNANIYVASMERLEDIFISTQLSLVNSETPVQEEIQTEWVDVIEMSEPASTPITVPVVGAHEIIDAEEKPKQPRKKK